MLQNVKPNTKFCSHLFYGGFFFFLGIALFFGVWNWSTDIEASFIYFLFFWYGFKWVGGARFLTEFVLKSLKENKLEPHIFNSNCLNCPTQIKIWPNQIKLNSNNLVTNAKYIKPNSNSLVTGSKL